MLAGAILLLAALIAVMIPNRWVYAGGAIYDHRTLLRVLIVGAGIIVSLIVVAISEST